MIIQPFGEIDHNNLENYYDGKIIISGNEIEIDLNFESESIDEKQLKKIMKYIENIDVQIKNAFEELSKDYDLGNESETAAFYLEHHKEELSKDELINIFGTTDISKELFFKCIKEKRIGLYPEDEEAYSIIDIKLPDKYTNYIMAVTYNKDNKLSYISMDS